MKKIVFFFLGVLTIGLYLFIDKNISSSYLVKENTETQVLLVNPVWKINNKTSKNYYQVNANKAEQDKTKDSFLLHFPVFKSVSKKQVKTSISSEKALLELEGKKLIMKNKVHLVLIQKDDKINLFGKEVNCDLKNSIFQSKEKIKIQALFFNLESKGFKLHQDQGDNLLTFHEAFFVQNNDQDSKSYGKADLIIYKSSSDVLTLVGSAEIKFDSFTLKAKEIVYNYKTKTIVSSKRSRMFNT